MPTELIPFFILLSFLWFLLYWIFGGVFFAIITILKLGRVRKVRFSIIFTLLAIFSGIGSSWFGLKLADKSVVECLEKATNKAEVITSIFGCGFAGVLSAFLFGALIVMLGGFIILRLSKMKSKPWIVLSHIEEEEPEVKSEHGKFF